MISILHWCAKESVKEREQSPVKEIFLMNNFLCRTTLDKKAAHCGRKAVGSSTADV
jgi:hypothetical protein